MLHSCSFLTHYYSLLANFFGSGIAFPFTCISRLSSFRSSPSYLVCTIVFAAASLFFLPYRIHCFLFHTGHCCCMPLLLPCSLSFIMSPTTCLVLPSQKCPVLLPKKNSCGRYYPAVRRVAILILRKNKHRVVYSEESLGNSG
jgi:hypothetical protein